MGDRPCRPSYDAGATKGHACGIADCASSQRSAAIPAEHHLVGIPEGRECCGRYWEIGRSATGFAVDGISDGVRSGSLRTDEDQASWYSPYTNRYSHFFGYRSLLVHVSPGGIVRYGLPSVGCRPWRSLPMDIHHSYPCYWRVRHYPPQSHPCGRGAGAWQACSFLAGTRKNVGGVDTSLSGPTARTCRPNVLDRCGVSRPDRV